MAKKRYQVFVSSTFTDLKEERREVIQALLELEFIPAGMELFQATTVTAWQLVERVISECDYYIVIVGARYGSMDEQGLSFTEKEYDYAVSLKKPVIGFLKTNPGDLREDIASFRAKVEKGRHVKYWTNASDLGGQVSRALALLERSEPGIGWIRADEAADDAEVLSLRRQVEKLTSRVAELENAPPPGSDKLAQGDDPITIKYQYRLVSIHEDSIGAMLDVRKPFVSAQLRTTWNAVFGALGPTMFNEASDDMLRQRLITLVAEEDAELWKEEARSHRPEIVISETTFDTVRVQLTALNLMRPGTAKRSAKDAQTYWQLTPFGESYLTRIRALPRFAALLPREDRPSDHKGQSRSKAVGRSRKRR
jgi:hypothetical protein